MKWALELSEYDIAFEPIAVMKGQTVADFIGELTPLPSSVEVSLSKWILNVDRSSYEKDSAVLLQAPSGDRFEYAVRFNSSLEQPGGVRGADSGPTHN